MEQRVNVMEKGQDALKPLFGLGAYLKKSSIEKSLLELVDLRISQINRCAFCLDMHSKDARSSGESEQRLYLLSAWREASSFYTDRERAALAWAEAVNAHDVPQQLFDEVSEHLSEKELIDLTVAVGALTIWNKLNHAFKPKVGTYEVGQYA